MTSNYLNQLINEFDQEFESLVIPFPEAYVVNSTETNLVTDDSVNSSDINITDENNVNKLSEKLNKIENLATQISAERYTHNYNPEICLANLLNCILATDDQDLQNDFFQILNQEHDMGLDEALNDFDFYLNNPYKKKAEKMLSKIEARKNK